MLLDCSAALTPYTSARLRASAAPLAGIPYTAYHLPTGTSLTDRQLQFAVLHRLGIPQPSIPSPPPPSCRPKCVISRPDNPFPPNHPLLPTLPHGYHPIACGAGPGRHRRHDALTVSFADTARLELGCTVDITKRLSTSLTSGRKSDCLISSMDLPSPLTSIDITVSCPLLPSHLAAASLDANSVFVNRATEKINKHLPGCVAAQQLFVPLVFTTLGGIGPSASRSLIDQLFQLSYTRELQVGGTGTATAYRRTSFLHRLHSILARHNHQMLEAYVQYFSEIAAPAVTEDDKSQASSLSDDTPIV